MEGPRITEQPYLSVEEVARRFGVTIRTIYRLAGEGTLPGFKVGNLWRFNKKTLQVWEKNRVAIENLKKEDHRED